jgi:hypothetical protein
MIGFGYTRDAHQHVLAPTYFISQSDKHDPDAYDAAAGVTLTLYLLHIEACGSSSS